MTSFILPDPYAGLTERQLKARLRKLGAALMRWELIAANMGTVPAALETLSPESRQKVERMMEAYSDGDLAGRARATEQ